MKQYVNYKKKCFFYLYDTHHKSLVSYYCIIDTFVKCTYDINTCAYCAV